MALGQAFCTKTKSKMSQAFEITKGLFVNNSRFRQIHLLHMPEMLWKKLWENLTLSIFSTWVGMTYCSCYFSTTITSEAWCQDVIMTTTICNIYQINMRMFGMWNISQRDNCIYIWFIISSQNLRLRERAQVIFVLMSL